VSLPRWPSSLRARLTLWYSVLLSLPLVAFAVASYAIVSRTLQDRTDRFIGDALSAFARELHAERRAALTVEDAMRRTLDEVHFRDLHIAILDTTGVHLMAATILPADRAAADSGSWSEVRDRISPALVERDLNRSLAFTLPGRSGSTRILAQPLAVSGRPFVLAGAYSLGDLEGVLGRIRGLFVIAIPLLIGLAALGGSLLARRSLSPVTSMVRRATEITASNLGERLPVGGARELASLAAVVNDLLDRLEHSFAQQRRFAADASHELRTPTAIVRSEADVTLSQDHRTEDEYRAAMEVVQDAARRLTRIVDDLFLLARADAGGGGLVRPEALYLEDLVHDAARAMRTVADRRAVTIELRQLIEAPFHGDADLLGRLLLNLLDNAVKHSPAGGVVEVEMARRNGQCEITVSDRGPGIAPELRDRIFEPFFRADGARARSSDREPGGTTGAGLGLAIARRIAEMHEGRLELGESRAGRTEFRLILDLRT